MSALAVLAVGFQRVQQHWPHGSDIAGAYSEDHVTMVGAHRHHEGGGMHIVDRSNPVRRLVFDTLRGVHDGLRGDIWEILLLFTCRINASDDHIVRERERLGEFACEEFGA